MQINSTFQTNYYHLLTLLQNLIESDISKVHVEGNEIIENKLFPFKG